MGFIQLTTEFLLSSTVWHIGHAINICRMNEYVSKMVIIILPASHICNEQHDLFKALSA